jgi:hypothetical protein
VDTDEEFYNEALLADGYIDLCPASGYARIHIHLLLPKFFGKYQGAWRRQPEEPGHDDRELFE